MQKNVKRVIRQEMTALNVQKIMKKTKKETAFLPQTL